MNLPPPTIELTDSPALAGEVTSQDLYLTLQAMRVAYGEPFARGLHRWVFDGGEVVYKVPVSVNEFAINEYEAQAYADPITFAHLPVAPCRIVHSAHGVPILIMQAVRPRTNANRHEIPDWACRIDGSQVGLDDAGNWLVYDAGLRPSSALCIPDGRPVAESPMPRIYQSERAS